MKSAFLTEWQKIMGYRNLVAFLIWIYPIGTIVGVLMVVILPTLFSESAKQLIVDSSPQWSEMTQAVSIFVRVPENIFIRMPMLAFMAVVFAGEYQWGTLKNSLPRSSRFNILMSKFLVVGLLVMLAVTTTSISWGIGRGVAAWIVGVPFGPEITETAVSEFVKAYLINSVVVFGSMLIASAIAALIAMYSRSILVSLFLGIAYAIVEPVAAFLVALASKIFDKPEWIALIRFTPAYNLDNFSSWISGSRSSFADNYPGFTSDFSGMTSLLMIVLWIVGLLILATIIFERQDISE